MPRYTLPATDFAEAKHDKNQLVAGSGKPRMRFNLLKPFIFRPIMQAYNLSYVGIYAYSTRERVLATRTPTLPGQTAPGAGRITVELADGRRAPMYSAVDAMRSTSRQQRLPQPVGMNR